jgi:flagellar assembly protein FliH
LHAVEGMISLSSIYKPYQVRTIHDPARITRHIAPSKQDNQELDDTSDSGSQLISRETANQIIAEAQALAEEMIRNANDEANQIRESVDLEITSWWESRRAEDEQLTELAQTQGFDSGYEQGIKLAEAEVKQQYEDVVLQAEQLVEQAFIVKNQIIAEAEPFLLELSVQIAEKIIQKQLSVDSEYQKELIQKLLSRKRDKGVITLCVSPTQFMVMNASREELSRSIDAQAELQIIPDASVQDHGCVIRSALGTIDARIDTQLNEIKKALLAVLSADEEVKE